jgi:quercetin dioxygenase-like cupin family protein
LKSSPTGASAPKGAGSALRAPHLPSGFAHKTNVRISAAVAVATAVLAACAFVQTAPAQDALSSSLMRREVQRAPLSIPGREVVQVLTEIPTGVASGWHTHPGEEVGYILAGDVEMMVAGRATATLHAGDGFIIPPNTPHNARDIGPETGRMLSTYIVQAGGPLSTRVEAPPDD